MFARNKDIFFYFNENAGVDRIHRKDWFDQRPRSIILIIHIVFRLQNRNDIMVASSFQLDLYLIET